MNTVPMHGEVTGHFVGALEHRNCDKLNAQLQTPPLTFPAFRPNGEPLFLNPLPGQQGRRGHGDTADEVGRHLVLVLHLKEEIVGDVAHLNMKARSSVCESNTVSVARGQDGTIKWTCDRSSWSQIVTG